MTSSLFGKIAKKKKWEKMSSFVFNSFFKTADFFWQIPAIKHGSLMEPKIFAVYSDMITNAQVVYGGKFGNQSRKNGKFRSV